MRYILWDWNGTLLDDTEAALNTLNEMLISRGGDKMTMEFYRDHFAFPVKPFYIDIGLPVEAEDWDKLALEYHQRYATQSSIKLNHDALTAVEMVKAAGCKESIISALREDLLIEDAKKFGIAPFMEHVCGSNNLNGASKLECAQALVAKLRAETRDSLEFVVIGDALHDFEVASAIGAKCVLHGEGSHAASRLRKVAPTCPTVLEATRLALDGIYNVPTN